jgi:hypothetical protein
MLYFLMKFFLLENTVLSGINYDRFYFIALIYSVHSIRGLQVDVPNKGIAEFVYWNNT